MQPLASYVGRAREKLASSLAGLLARRFGIGGDAIRNVWSFMKLSGPATSGFPTELLPLGASMWSGYVITPFAQQQMPGWVLPYWLRMQSLPSSRSFVPHGHAFLHPNMTHRNWTGVGLSGYPKEATVDVRGLVTPWPFSPSVDAWVLGETGLTCPSELDSAGQQLVEGMPIVRTDFGAGETLDCEWTTFVAPTGGIPVVLSEVTLYNSGTREARLSIVISVRPYNNESVSAINHLSYDPDTRLFDADGNDLVYLPVKPDRVLLSDYVHGDVAKQLRSPERQSLPEGTHEVYEPYGLSTGAAVYDLRLPAGGKASVGFACPLSPGVHIDFDRLLPSEEATERIGEKLTEQVSSWARIAAEGMRVQIPDDDYQKAFDVNKRFLLLFYDGGSITPGVSTYHMMWFRDAAYLIPALERSGHLQEARGILLTYPDRQTPEGFFKSHSGEWDSNGQAMWTLVNHYRMTGDTDFLKDVYPSIMKGARWIDSMRQKDISIDDPRYGLLPEGISAEHFGISDCYYWDDFWAWGGLESASLAARELGLDCDSRYLEQLAADLARDLESSWVKVERRLGEKVMPVAPCRDLDAASVGNVVAVYPLDIISCDRPLFDNTLRALVRQCFHRDMHYHGMTHCGLNPYLSMQVAQCFLRKRDPYSLRIFESTWSMASDTCTFPEAINPLTGGGAFGDGHHGWSASELFNFVRNLLLLEEQKKLVLLAVPKPAWFSQGTEILVENAPSHFGNLSYRVVSSDNQIEFTLPGDFERPPEVIELNSPYPIVSVEVDGQAANHAGGGAPFVAGPSARRVTLTVKRDSSGGP